MTIPLVVICGPTATGKTGLGVQLAKRFGGEIVSADSRQVYKTMNIGTGKDASEHSVFQRSKVKVQKLKADVGYHVVGGVRVWLYDMIAPNERMSAGAYAKAARAVIENIYKRGSLPILVGGSGLYVRAVVDGFDIGDTPPDWGLREKLDLLDVPTLQSMLKDLGSDRLSHMNNSDRNNPRRLVRAIEVETLSRSDKSTKAAHKDRSLYKAVFIGLTSTREVLQEKIDRRVEKRISQGVEEEIRSLLDAGFVWDDPGFNSMGYKEWRGYFEKRVEKKEVVAAWKQHERSYAKRQLVWFKKEKRIWWCDTQSLNIQLVASHIEKSGVLE